MTTEKPAFSENLAILWSSGDRDVALTLVYPYARNSKIRGWWDQVRLIVWGPSEKILAYDAELQDGLYGLKKEGVEVVACKGCSDNYETSGKLEELGVEVIYMGEPLTRMLKDGWRVLTF